jgi:hypothetical protein
MLRHRGAAVFLIALTSPVVVISFAPSAGADAYNFTLGIKAQYATLTRTLKIGPDRHRLETPQSGAGWMRGVVFNGSRGPLFFGADYRSSTLVDSEGPLSPSGIPTFKKDVTLDVSELNLALGYSIAPWLGPFVGYVRHTQRTDADCTGCIASINLRAAGPGVLIQYPLSSLRWAVSVKAAMIQGFSLEGTLSYAGIRWPLVAAVGYAYRRLDYPAGDKASCGQGSFVCFRDRDVFSGPTVAVHYVF